MFKIRSKVFAFGMFLVSNTLIASKNFDEFQINVYGGVSQTKTNPKTLYLLGEPDSLYPYHYHQNENTWGVGVSRRLQLNHDNKSANHVINNILVGVDVFSIRTNQRGSVWQYNLPVYNNFIYHFAISSIRVMVNGEIDFRPVYAQVYPFIQGSIGIAGNRTSYQDIPVQGYNGNGHYIPDYNAIQLAYGMGAGLKIPLTKSTYFSLRYLYTNLGYAITVSSGNLIMSDNLKASLSTQSILFGLSCLI